MKLPSLALNSAWLSPDVVHALGWTLIHFLWEGLALALCFQLLANLCRTARARYNLAFATLAAMAAAPVITYASLITARAGAAGDDPGDMAVDITRGAAAQIMDGFSTPAAVTSPWLSGLVLLWLAGVALLSLRVAGGWYVANSLRRRDVKPLSPALRARFECLRIQLEISRPVQFLQSAIVNAPAVVGWLRPVVLIPISAVVGLTPAQLEAVIIHELAHIRRFDALANLLQMAVETALFYHPAVWWISRRIRIEREHCCDDVAVTMSGDALDFAKALASLEEWRAMPLPVLAANGGVLKHRIARLLGLTVRSSHMPVMSVAGVGLICLAGCVVAHGADMDANSPAVAMPFPGLALIANNEPTPLLIPPTPPSPVPSITPLPFTDPVVTPMPSVDNINIRIHGRHDDGVDAARDAAERARDLQRELAQEQADLAHDRAQEARDQARDKAREAREQLRADVSARTRNLDPNHTHSGKAPAAEDAAYVAALAAAGLKDVDADDVLALKSLGVSADYVRDVAAAGIAPRLKYLLAFKSQSITAAYIKGVRASWPEASANDIISMSALGVSAADAAAFRKSGAPDLSVKQLVSYKALGVTPEFVRALNAAGIKDLSVRDYSTAKVRGITPEFLDAVRKHGFSNLSMRQLIALKDADVL